MEEDYIEVISALRGQGRSDSYIINTLIYGKEYNLDPSRAKALVGGTPKKKRELTVRGSLGLQSSDVNLESSSEEGQRIEASYANPSKNL